MCCVALAQLYSRNECVVKYTSRCIVFNPNFVQPRCLVLHVRHEDGLRRAVGGPVDDLEGESALQEAPVKALQRRETALGARDQGDGAFSILVADE